MFGLYLAIQNKVESRALCAKLLYFILQVTIFWHQALKFMLVLFI